MYTTPEGDLFADATTDAWEPGNAHLDERSFTEWARSDGFRLAAELLVKAAREADPLDGDRLVFPIVFLYRHAVELKLKEFLGEGWAYLRESREVPNIHDLVALWELGRDIIDRCPVGKIEPYLTQSDTTIRQLQAVDNRAGTSFRYARDRDGNRSLPDDLTLIDPSRVSERLQAVIDALDGWETGISEATAHRAESEEEYSECQAELVAEHRAEMAAEIAESARDANPDG